MNFREKKNYLAKMQSFLEVSKKFKFATILVYHLHQSSLGLENMTSGLTHLTCFNYLCKFNLAVHTKCWKGAFCMDFKAKFTEVKQARRIKPEVTHF